MTEQQQQQEQQSEKPPTRAAVEHTYTKLQVHFGGDIHDIVIKSDKEPTCRNLAKTLEHTFRIPVDSQLIYYRGQRLHHRHEKNYNRALSSYGIFPEI